MKANRGYQKKRTTIIIAIIAVLAILATIGTVVYVRGNRRAAAATPEVVGEVDTADNNSGNNGGQPTELPQLGDEAEVPTLPENNGETVVTNNGTTRTTITNANAGNNANVPSEEYTQTTIIPEGGDEVLVEETDTRSWQPVGVNKSLANAQLDVDALKVVAKSILGYHKEHKPSILIITHHKTILENIKPDYVHILKDGNIKKTGDYKLVEEIEKNGYKMIGD